MCHLRYNLAQSYLIFRKYKIVHSLVPYQGAMYKILAIYLFAIFSFVSFFFCHPWHFVTFNE